MKDKNIIEGGEDSNKQKILTAVYGRRKYKEDLENMMYDLVLPVLQDAFPESDSCNGTVMPGPNIRVEVKTMPSYEPSHSILSGARFNITVDVFYYDPAGR